MDKEEGKKEKSQKVSVDSVSKEKVLEILHEIISSQERIKVVMKEITSDLNKSKMSFEETYKRVKSVQPEDPLEKYGLSMMDFDQLLDKFQADPAVRNAIGQIMGAGVPQASGPQARQTTQKQVVEVHAFMLEELKSLVDEFNRLSNKSEFDMKTVTIAAQAIVGAKVEAKYNLTTEDVESAVMIHHMALGTDQEFARINIEMQQTMAHLMGSEGHHCEHC